MPHASPSTPTSLAHIMLTSSPFSPVTFLHYFSLSPRHISLHSDSHSFSTLLLSSFYTFPLSTSSQFPFLPFPAFPLATFPLYFSLHNFPRAIFPLFSLSHTSLLFSNFRYAAHISLCFPLVVFSIVIPLPLTFPHFLNFLLHNFPIFTPPLSPCFPTFYSPRLTFSQVAQGRGET